MVEKKELRKNLRNILNGLPPAAYQTQGTAAARCIRSKPVWTAAKAIFVFLSTDTEIETVPIIDNALADGKIVYVPKIIDNTIEIFPIVSSQGPWELGAFDIKEPKAGPGPIPPLTESLLAPKNAPFIVFAPGLGFNRAGLRLGHGKGFYDKFFERIDKSLPPNTHPYTIIGLCLKEQLVPEVPTNQYDIPMNIVIAGSEYIEVK
ncbi:5-formyltetrahydrofolate cyclo-ligase [Breznakiellaceae bacterium SP9]